MIGKLALSLAVLAAFGTANALAATKMTHDKPKIRPLGSGLASEFKVPRAEVTRLRDRGLSWGEVRRALAQKTGKPAGVTGKKSDLKKHRGNRRSK